MPLDAAAIDIRREWEIATTSRLASHGPCCAAARAWLLARARTQDFCRTDRATLAAPRWLTRQYKWGPTSWPIAWCEAVTAPTIDCGVFAVFARAIFAAKGLKVHGGQVIRQQDAATVAHWREKWAQNPEAFPWIGQEHVFHEIVAVQINEDEVKIYDPTDGYWLDSEICAGHNSHIAIRIDSPRTFAWGKTRLGRGQWTKIYGES